MLQTAVFVDAGYVYDQGAASLGFARTPRYRLRLDVPLIVAELQSHAGSVEPRGRLLRIYWYDGLRRGGQLNPDQVLLTESANVKCRFGIINSYNQQKGVDPLIVTDLIELARGHAISDAVILGGDEDLRVGVQVAQAFGIRVHLLGIQAARGSQSRELLAEADTAEEWSPSRVERWLAILPAGASLDSAGEEGDDWLEQVVEQRAGMLTVEEAQDIADFAADNANQLPADFDRPSLGFAGKTVGRDLSAEERKAFRARLLEAVLRRAEEPE